MYRDQGVDFQTADATLGELVQKAATLPLLAQPGTAWNYSIATDVIGHLVAEISGMPFEQFLHDRVIAPLGMTDTAFTVAPGNVPRFAANYMKGEDGKAALLDDPATSRFITPPLDRLRRRRPDRHGARLHAVLSHDAQQGRASTNEQLLGRKTVELMTSNHLGGDMAAMGMPRFSESKYDGVGFGLGFSIMLDPAKAEILGTPGEFAWGGAASTAFWIDPVEDMAVVLLDPAHPVEHLPDPPRIACPDLRRDRRLAEDSRKRGKLRDWKNYYSTWRTASAASPSTARPNATRSPGPCTTAWSRPSERVDADPARCAPSSSPGPARKPLPLAPISASSATFNSRRPTRSATRQRIDRVLTILENCRVPTIAAIAGACTGGGAAIAACCDLRIAATGRPLRLPDRQDARKLPLDGQSRPTFRADRGGPGQGGHLHRAPDRSRGGPAHRAGLRDSSPSMRWQRGPTNWRAPSPGWHR